MTCRRCRRLLSPHLDNALGADERSWVIAHLAQCAACAELLRQLESNRQLLRALPTVEVTRGMELRLQSTIRGSDSGARSFPAAIRNPRSAVQSWWRGWPLVSAGTLAAGAVSLFLFFSNIHPPPAIPAEEVVGSMNELINVLAADDDFKVMYEETAEEALPDWREDLDRWPVGDETELRLVLE